MAGTVTARARTGLDRLAALARRRFSHALMSDTKWRRLFIALEEAGVAVRWASVKFIDVADPKPMTLPTGRALHPPRPYVDTLEFGPIELRAIEWLEMPAVVLHPRGSGLPPRAIPQDLDGAEAALAARGRFPLERPHEALRVLGYRR
jgi:hypothetical protein